MWWKVAWLLVLACLTAAVPARAAAPEILFTIAGVESTGAPACTGDGACATLPLWPEGWTATDRRLVSTCLEPLADGTIALCERDELLALGRDGRLRHWMPAGSEIGVGTLLDADAAPDGSLVVLGDRGVARVLRDGGVRQLVPPADPTEPVNAAYGTAVAALPDGGIALVLGDPNAYGIDYGPAELVRVSPDGIRTSIARVESGRPTRFTSDATDDLAVLPDGSVAVARHGYQRVLRVDPAGRVRVLAGGGTGGIDRTRASAARLGAVTALVARHDGSLLVAADRGLVVVDRARRLRRVAGGAPDESEPSDSRALTTDGRPVGDSVLAGVRRLGVTSDQMILALIAGVSGDTRVVAIAPLRHQRLAVALPARDRVLVRRGRLDVLATQTADATITIEHRGVALTRTRIALHRGRNRIRVRVPSRPDALTTRVRATNNDGAVSTHQLAVLADWVLSVLELRRITRLVARSFSGAVNDFSVEACLRASPQRFRCRWRYADEESVSTGPAAVELRRDGLISFAEQDSGGRTLTRLLFEPR